jgi:peptidyl-prolyl cis-trans isomerase C
MKSLFKANVLSPVLKITTFTAAGVFAVSVFAQNAAVVNNKAIPKAKVDEFVEAMVKQGRPDTPELRAMVRDELIAREVFVQAAEKQGLARSPEVARQLENVRQDLMIRAFLTDHMKKNPIKEDDMKAEYDKFKKTAGDKEYKARHILVESEDVAKGLVDQLKKGAKFEDLAKQSKDTGSAQKGGDLDWNAPATFVKPFADAMVKLEKGKFTETPVQSQFGFHVIRLDDVRATQPPPYEQVKPQIKQELERKAVADLQKKMRESAKVQ